MDTLPLEPQKTRRLDSVSSRIGLPSITQSSGGSRVRTKFCVRVIGWHILGDS